MDSAPDGGVAIVSTFFATRFFMSSSSRAGSGIAPAPPKAGADSGEGGGAKSRLTGGGSLAPCGADCSTGAMVLVACGLGAMLGDGPGMVAGHELGADEGEELGAVEGNGEAPSCLQVGGKELGAVEGNEEAACSNGNLVAIWVVVTSDCASTGIVPTAGDGVPCLTTWALCEATCACA